MTTKQEIEELKATIKRLTERIEQLEARPPVFVTPYIPATVPYPVYQPLRYEPFPSPTTVPNPYRYNPPITVCVNE